MNKTTIVVPAGIRYLSEWPDFKFPGHPCIINKRVPGCGFTEFCIGSEDDVILCSPRKVLLKNKTDQHPDDVIYINPESFGIEDLEVDKDKYKPPTTTIPINNVTEVTVENEVDELDKIKFAPLLNGDEISKNYQTATIWISKYIQDKRSANKPVKILVTYDSFKYVKDILISLNENISNYHVVVDEFQSIFTDSSFKSEIEFDFTNSLKTLNNVYFVSATPMMESYLDQVDPFNTLPYYELDWESAQPERLIRPYIKSRKVKSIVSEGTRTINEYKNKQFNEINFRDLIFVKSFGIYYHAITFNTNDFLDSKDVDKIYSTYYFIFCIEQLFSTILVLNLICFYRKTWFFNTMFIIISLIIFF